MATPRSRLVNLSRTAYYHCISRCARKGYLGGGENRQRKDRIERRLQELVGIFAIDCAGYAIVDDDLHVLLRIDAARADEWTPAEVARRWCRLFPIRTIDGEAYEPSETWIKKLIENPKWVVTARDRLRDLGWFMKWLKEPIAKAANREERCKGIFWDGRFRSVGLPDKESLFAVCAYLDLKPLAAGSAPTLGRGEHASFNTTQKKPAISDQARPSTKPNQPLPSTRKRNDQEKKQPKRNSKQDDKQPATKSQARPLAKSRPRSSTVRSGKKKQSRDR